MAAYTAKVDALLEHATQLGFTEDDFADLALAAADQSGASVQEQGNVARILGVTPFAMRPCVVCGGVAAGNTCCPPERM